MIETMRLLPLCAACFVLGAISNVPCEVQSAPAPKSAEVVGRYKIGSFNSPVVVLNRDDEERDYWVVFTDPALEVQARKIESGERTRVTGKIGFGGGYHYVIATDIRKDE